MLSRNLLQAGKTVLVIDYNRSYTASKVASGVINPVTGRRIVRTWRIEELLPFAWKIYKKIGLELNLELVRQCDILDFHPTRQMHEAFESRLPEENEFLHTCESKEAWDPLFNFHYGIGLVSPCLLVELNSLLAGWRRFLLERNLLFEHQFSWGNCKVQEDHIEYGDILAEKIICCDGVESFNNPYFKNLPWSRMKGEALIASIPGLPHTNIFKQGINIVPWQNDLFWIGSTYEWKFDTLGPTPAWKEKVAEHLRQWLKLPFTIVDHLASERPANMERRPFVGLHPAKRSVGILNGMGAKGCSLAPFFAHQFASHLVAGTTIYADANVNRFSKVLARNIN